MTSSTADPTKPTGDTGTTSIVRIAVVNDFELVVRGLTAMLAPFGDRVVVVETSAGGVPAGSADIALFDTFGGHRSALDRIDSMVEDRSLTRVVLYTWDAEGEIVEMARKHDVDAVVSKSTTGDDLVVLLERIHRGEEIGPSAPVAGRAGSLFSGGDDRLSALSAREAEVLAILADGASNKAIAGELFVSAETIKSHVRSILAKLGAKNRTEAALIAHDLGLVRSD